MPCRRMPHTARLGTRPGLGGFVLVSAAWQHQVLGWGTLTLPTAKQATWLIENPRLCACLYSLHQDTCHATSRTRILGLIWPACICFLHRLILGVAFNCSCTAGNSAEEAPQRAVPIANERRLRGALCNCTALSHVLHHRQQPHCLAVVHYAAHSPRQRLPAVASPHLQLEHHFVDFCRLGCLRQYLLVHELEAVVPSFLLSIGEYSSLHPLEHAAISFGESFVWVGVDRGS